MNLIIAGPWIGEFGWELMGWHGYLRGLSKNYKLVCIGPESTKYLYEDFASEYHCLDKKIIKQNCGAADMYNCQNISFDDLKEYIHYFSKKNNFKNFIWFPPHSFVKTFNSHYHHYKEKFSFMNKETISPVYRTLGDHLINSDFDYVFHARCRKDIRPEDNWSEENWNKLFYLIKEKEPEARICSIGSKISSMHIQGSKDLRDEKLEKVCSILNNSKAVFGPSSGAMHLASQCNARVVVWSKENNKNRYCEWWNPHLSPTLFLGRHKWHPKAEYVFEQFNYWNKNDIISDI